MKSDNPTPNSDESLLEQVRAVLVEPAPADVEAAAVEIIGRHTPRRPAVPAVYDSVFEGVPVGVRGGGPRAISFESDEVSIDIEVITDRGVRVIGQVAPASPGAVMVRAGNAEIRADLDDLGRFQVDGVAAGAFQIVVDSADSVFETDWITL